MNLLKFTSYKRLFVLITFHLLVINHVKCQTPVLQTVPLCGNSNSVFGSLVFSNVACYTGNGETVALNLTGTQALVIKSGASITFSSISIASGAKLFIEAGAIVNVSAGYSLDGTIINYGNLYQNNLASGLIGLTINSGANLYNENTMTVGGSLYLKGTSFNIVNGGNMTIGYVDFYPGILNNLSPVIFLCPNGCTYTGVWTVRPGSVINIIGAGYSDANATTGAIGASGGCITSPNGGLFQYGSGDISGNTCTNKARINFYGTIQTLDFVAPGFGATNYLINEPNILIVGSGLTTGDPGNGCTHVPFVGPATVSVNSGVGDPRLFTLSSVQQSPLPLVPFSSINYCQGGVSQLAANALPTSTALTWYTSLSGNSGQTTTVPIPVTAAGTAPVTYYVSQTVNGCEGPRAPIYVTVSANAASPSSITVSSPSTICSGTSLDLLGPSGYSGIWTGPAFYTSTTLSPTVAVNSTTTMSGVYTLKITQGAGATACNLNANTSTIVTSKPVVSQVPTSGLIAYYKLNGNAVDETNLNQGTLQAGPTSTTDRFSSVNSALSLNGTTQYISTSKQFYNPSNFSLSLWFKTTTTTGGKLIGFGSSQTGPSTQRDRMIWMDDGGRIYFGVNPGGGGYMINGGPNYGYNDGDWHHVVATCSNTPGEGISLYIDGVLTSSNPSALGGQIYNGYWRIGYDLVGWTNNPTSPYFNGTLDEVMIYNRAITSSEVITLYKSPDGAISNSPVCDGGTLNLSSPFISGATYSWAGPNGFTSSSQNATVSNMNLAKSGVYTLTVVSGGCISTASLIGKVNENLGVNISEITTTGLLHRYKLNANAFDVMDTNKGTLVNNPSTTSDRFGIADRAYAFNGTDQYMYTKIRYNNPTDFTISMWFMTTSVTGGKLIGFGNYTPGGSTVFDRHIYMTNSGQLYFGVKYQSASTTINTNASYNDGNWHHVVASLSSTNGIKLYVDGNLLASNSAAISGENFPGFWKIAYDNIGSTWPNAPTSSYFKGNIDDVIIYGVSLSDSDVELLYTAPDGVASNSPICEGGTLNFSSPFIPGATYSWTGPNGFTASTQNPNRTLMNNTMSGVYTLTITSGGCTSSGSVIAEINDNLGPNLSQINTSSLIHRYKLNANPYDIMNTNNGTLVNSPLPTTDRFGVANKAYIFNGTSQYMGTKLMYPSPNVFTISMWFKTTTTTGGKLMGFGNRSNGGSTAFDRHVYMNNSGQLYFGVKYSGTPTVINSPGIYNDGNWHQVIASLSNTNGIKLYVDGVLVAANEGAVGAENFSGFWRIAYDQIGSSWPSTPTSSYFKGSIDDVIIYNTELTASDIAQIYNSPDGIDYNEPVCAGSDLNFSIATIAGATYSWTGPDGFTSSLQNPEIPNITTSNEGVYSLTVNSGGCLSDSKRQINLSVSPAVPVALDAERCGPGSVTLSASGSSGTYQWYDAPIGGNIIGSAASISPTINSSSTFYVVAVSEGCESLRIQVKGTVLNPSNGGLESSITLSEKLINDNDAEISLSGNVDNVIRWEASDDSLFKTPSIINLTSQELSVYNKTKQYFRSVILSDECIMKYTKPIQVTWFMIYTTITPNGDDENDLWIIDGIESYPDNKVKIFNRWGNLVYSQDGYNNIDKVWDGSSRSNGLRIDNEDASEGTYFYHIALGNGLEKTGYIVLKKH